MGIENQRVPFRLIKMPCCGHQCCWVNPRLPNYCPECGKVVLPRLAEAILFTDFDAELMTHA